MASQKKIRSTSGKILSFKKFTAGQALRVSGSFPPRRVCGLFSRNKKMSEAEIPEPAPIAPAIAAASSGRPPHELGRAGLPKSAVCLPAAQTGPGQLAGDILHGADEIAEFLYGDRKSRRKVYHLVESAQLPVFRLGVNICARKSVLLGWIEEQERRQAVSGPLSEE